MKQRFIVTESRPNGPVFLCWGGGAFMWWTVHRSMASCLRKEDAERLQVLRGGNILPHDMEWLHLVRTESMQDR